MNNMNLFGPNKFERILLPCPRSRQCPDRKVLHGISTGISETGTEYVAEYVKKEEQELLESAKSRQLDSNKKSFDEISQGSVLPLSEIDVEDRIRIYQQYNFEHRMKTNLTIMSMKDKIVSMIETNSVVVIHGPTGCGKTTQVPQFILDSCYKRKVPCKIIVTQPRRIAAINIAQRVAQERDWRVGTLVGYQVGLINNTSKDTLLTYCTTGVLLHKLINAKHMYDYTHIVLDEVHERDQDMDFLLLIVKRLLRTNSRHVKIILMSATFNVEKFSTYFSSPLRNRLVPAPVINIEKRNYFNVSVFYSSDILSLGPVPSVFAEEPKVTQEMMNFCLQMVIVLDDLDKQESSTDYDPKTGLFQRHVILIFLPGIHEIEEMHNLLSLSKYQSSKWDIVVLHSSITREEQQRIFQKPPPGYRRIILSTNIAESSITVPDVKYVIDFCLTKQLVTDPTTNFQCLEITWASKANCEQRAGRTGRVMNGRVYRLVPKNFYESILPTEGIPEILCAPLENVVLKTKLLDMGEPKALLALSLDPPNLDNLERTILLLKEAGALLNRMDYQQFDGELTILGRIMAKLPLDIRTTKLIMLGHVFGVLQEAIIIGCGMALKDVFSNPFRKRFLAYKARLSWAQNPCSDGFAFLNAYKVWRNEKANRCIDNNERERTWARTNFIQIRALREVEALVKDVTMKLRAIGIEETMGPNKVLWNEHERLFILQTIMAGAFYPNYFIKLPQNCETNECGRAKLLGGLNPTNTVYLQGWPINQPGKLYARKIQKVFADCLDSKPENIKISFDGSSRVYVQLKDPQNVDTDLELTKKIPHTVYKAIKMRHCNMSIKIPLLPMYFKNEYCSYEETQYSENFSPNRYVEPPEDPECTSNAQLEGPFSPLEVELTNLTLAGKGKKVKIDSNSVNSVLLDANIKDPHIRLLVAGFVGQSVSGDTLTIRHTTLMPNIPGLTALLTLIFTPQMEVRRSKTGSYYIGALCGLGYDPTTKKSIFREHDIEMQFDVEITIDDLENVNRLRHWMNVGMIINKEAGENVDFNDILVCQKRIKEIFLQLVYKPKKSQKMEMINDFGKWARYDNSMLLEPGKVSMVRNSVYNLHYALELNERNEEFEKTADHIAQLRLLAADDMHVPKDKLTCNLCSVDIPDVINLRCHLLTAAHREKEAKYAA